ncbi:uncharacterized protein LOC144448174 [Glandiceps talaboti]
MWHVRLLKRTLELGKPLTGKWKVPIISPITTKAVGHARLFVRYLSISTHRHGIVRSRFPDLQIPTDVSLPQYVMSNFEKYGDQVAMVEGLSNRHFTYRQLNDLVGKCGSGLMRAGFKQGDVCALYKPNIPEYFLSFYSVASIGGVNTAINPASTVEEFVYRLQNAEAKWIITVPSCVDKAKEAAQRVANIKGIFVVGGENSDGCIPFSKLMEDDGSAFPTGVKINPKEDMVVLPYSSGTTGLPKGVMLTHYNIISNLEQMRISGMLKLDSGLDVIISVVPNFNIAGLVLVLASGLHQGSTLVTLPTFEPEPAVLLKCIEEHKVTSLYAVPPLITFFAKHPMVDNYDLSSMKHIGSGAAPLGARTVESAKDRLSSNIRDLVIRQGYGLTESSPLLTMCSLHHEFDPASVGMLLPNTYGKVVDMETGEILGVGQVGELCFQGPQIMKGYLKNENATREMVKDDWLYTGDIGYYDETGHFFVIDRCKEVIKYRGFQIAPAELEELLLTNQDIQDVAVIGLPDMETGEVPKAFVVPKSDKLTSEDVIKFVEENAAPQKRLRGGVEFINNIPRSGAGKIMRRVLRARKFERKDNN